MFGIIFGLVLIGMGFYSAKTRKPGYIARQNLYGLLTDEQYEDYVHKVGKIYIGLGATLIVIYTIFDNYDVPIVLQFLIIFCLTYPLFRSMARLNKRYFEVSEPNFLKKEKQRSDD